MLNPAHVLETAFLILAAFLVGAVIGSLLKVLVLRLTAKPKVAMAAAAQAVVAPVPQAAALVASPVIAPTVKPAQPQAPSEVPTPDFTAVAQALATQAEVTLLSEIRMPKVALSAEPIAPAMAPAREAGKTTSGKQVRSPQLAPAARVPVDTDAPSADVIPFPVDRTSATADELATADIEPTSEAPTAAIPSVEAAIPPTEPARPVEVTAAAIEPSAPEAAPAEPPEDETAAMRAIEGNWTPRRTGRRVSKAPTPEGVDEEPPAAPELPGRPTGIATPRGGVKDNLTNVIGILPVIETSLNSIGIFHFDQLSQFSDENVAWLENHLGIFGRIDREHWREQARELAVISDRARKVAGQQ